jgi:hypothetical protein
MNSIAMPARAGRSSRRGRVDGAKRLSPIALSSVAATMLFFVAIGSDQARDLCEDIGYLIDQSQSHFQKIVEKPSGNTDDYHVTRSLDRASFCVVTKKSTRNWYRCAWEFPHRAEQAYDAYEELVRELDECIGQDATLHEDQSVNHPDYYASRRYEMGQAEVSVSVKDKVELGSTFVFVKIQSLAPGISAD